MTPPDELTVPLQIIEAKLDAFGRSMAEGRDVPAFPERTSRAAYELLMALRGAGFLIAPKQFREQQSLVLTERAQRMIRHAYEGGRVVPEYVLGIEKTIEMVTGYLTGERL